MTSAYSKTVVLTLIREKKDILFGSLAHPLTNEDRHRAWKEVSEKAKRLGILKNNKNLEYVRDVTWANWKRRTLEKRDNKRKTGTGGGKGPQYTELDHLVLDIIGRETPIVEGLNVPESMDNRDEEDVELLSIHGSPARASVSPLAGASSGNKAAAKPSAKPKNQPKVMRRVSSAPATVRMEGSDDVSAEAPPPLQPKSMEHSRPRVAAKRQSSGNGSDHVSKKAQLQLELMEIDKRTKAIQLYKLEKKFYLPASEFTREFHEAITQQSENFEDK